MMFSTSTQRILLGICHWDWREPCGYVKDFYMVPDQEKHRNQEEKQIIAQRYT